MLSASIHLPNFLKCLELYFTWTDLLHGSLCEHILCTIIAGILDRFLQYLF